MRSILRPIAYLVGAVSIMDGILHLIFPQRWGSLWAQSLMVSVPYVGEQVEKGYSRLPYAAQRGQGLIWLGIGAFLIWLAGPAESRSRF